MDTIDWSMDILNICMSIQNDIDEANLQNAAEIFERIKRKVQDIRNICYTDFRPKRNNMTNVIKLCAKRKKHKELVILYYDTPLGRKELEKDKENLIRRGYSVTSGPNR